MIHTYLTDHLGLRYPVVGAPMAGVAAGALARAISRAGGLGLVGISSETATAFIATEASLARGDDNTRFGLALMIWAVEQRPELLDAAIEARPTLLSLSFGSTAPYISRVHNAGILVATQVNTIAAAREAEAVGVDIIVAQGTEAGGHSHSAGVGTLPLLQGCLDAVSAPVLAAGGIGTARGLAAVLAAGADGAWIGTAFLASPECANSEESRRRIIAAHEDDTILTGVFDRVQELAWPEHHPGRALRNRLTDEWHDRVVELPGNSEVIAAYRQARAAGDYDLAVIYAGQAVGLVTREQPAGDLLRSIGDGAEILLRRRCDTILSS